MAVRDGRPASLATWRSSAQAGHLGGSPGLVNEHKPPGIEVELSLEPGFAGSPYVVALLLAGMCRLFLNVMLRLSKKCQTVALHTDTSRSKASRSAIS